MKNVQVPKCATHLKLISGGAVIDFDYGTFEQVFSHSEEIKIENVQVASIELLNQLKGNGNSPLFLVFGIEFYQLVNGVSYSMEGENCNALRIGKCDKDN